MKFKLFLCFFVLLTALSLFSRMHTDSSVLQNETNNTVKLEELSVQDMNAIIGGSCGSDRKSVV